MNKLVSSHNYDEDADTIGETFNQERKRQSKGEPETQGN